MATDALTTLNFSSYVGGLSNAASLSGTDIFYVVQSGTSKKATGTQIAALVPAGQPSQSNTAYFNVRNYGAAGNGTTDDTVAINSAIAALNTAGAGVLYFPAGNYKVTAPLTTITANAKIMGDGSSQRTARAPALISACSLITYTSNNTSCFTVNNVWAKFCDISIEYLGALTPTTGSAGITVASANALQKVDYDSIIVAGFMICVDVQTGAEWLANNVQFADFTQYGLKIRNTNNPDAGDWAINNCWFLTGTATGVTGLRVESSGGGKVANCKFNSGPNQMATCLDVESGGTVDFLVSHCSFENFSQTGINVNGPWSGFVVSGCQFGAWASAPLSAISINNNPTSIIMGCAFNGSNWGSATALIVLTNSAGAVIGPNVVDGSITIPVHN